MPTTIRFDPYAISHELEMRMLDRYDPQNEHRWEPRSGEESDSELVFNLAEDGEEWTQLRVAIEVTLSEFEISRILPPTADLRRDTLLVVTVRCPRTLSRDVVVLQAEEAGRWTGDIILHHSAVRGVVTLQPRLVRTTGTPDPSQVQAGIASEQHALIADGKQIKLIIDETDPPLSGALPIKWEDFRDSTNAWRAAHPSDIHYLDTAGPEPTVWLNSRYTSLKAALHSTTPHGPEAILRHMGNALIAQSVWFQLFLVSAAAIDVDPELGTVVKPSGWRGATLNALLPKLFPEHAEEDERLEELSTHLNSEAQVGSLVTRLGSAIQENLPTHRRIEDAIAAGERTTRRGA